MIFRPYNKKKIAFLTVPFTPGILPKKREQFSKSLSKSIIEYLLNSAFFLDYLQEKVFTKNSPITLFIINSWNKIKTKSVYEVIPLKQKKKFRKQIFFLKKKFLLFLKGEKFSAFFFEKDKDFFKKTKYSQIQLAYEFLYLSEFFIDWCFERLKKLNIKDYSRGDFGKISLQDFLSDSVYLVIQDYLVKKWDSWIDEIEDLSRTESYDEVLKNLIAESLTEFLKKQFLGSQKLFFKVWNLEKKIDEISKDLAQIFIKKIFEQAKKTENKEKIIDFILKKIKIILDSPLEEFYQFYSKNEKISFIWNESLEKVKENLLKRIYKRRLALFILRNLLKDSNKKYLTLSIKSFQKSVLYKSLIFKANEKVNNLIYKTPIDGILQPYLGEINNKMILIFCAQSYKKIYNFIAYKADVLLYIEKELCIKIEKKINSFPMSIIESMTFSIMNDQLKWINLLGGLIGFIIGLMQVLSIYFLY